MPRNNGFSKGINMEEKNYIVQQLSVRTVNRNKTKRKPKSDQLNISDKANDFSCSSMYH